jgi:D-proline reductase (dithiol) PrdB
MDVEISRKCVPYTPVTKGLAEMRFAIVSTAGVHLQEQEPFNTEGDETYRVLPADAASDRLAVTHGAPEEHYDRSEVRRDINVIFPIDRLRELAAQGVIGGFAEKHITLMGYSMRLRKIYDETAPAVAREIERSDADAVLLTAG